MAISHLLTLFKGSGEASGIATVMVMVMKQSICILSLISWGVLTFGRHCTFSGQPLFDWAVPNCFCAVFARVSVNTFTKRIYFSPEVQKIFSYLGT